MRRSKKDIHQLVTKIETEIANGEKTIEEACKSFGIQPSSYYRWKKSKTSSASYVDDPEKQAMRKEISTLKEIVGDLTLRLRDKE